MFFDYLKSLHVHNEERKRAIERLKVLCKEKGTVKISRAMKKDDSYISNILKKKDVSDKTIMAILDTIIEIVIVTGKL